MNPETKICQNCKTDFIIEPEDFAFYEKVKVPAPTWCPECRMVRRMTFYNERNLYRRKDSLTGKEIFSAFPPEFPAPVYEKDYWWSDAWDPMDYGRDYDFSRSFFEQMRDLTAEVPRPSRNVQNLVNSDYANNVGDLKNCYLCFNGGGSEDSAYLVDAYYQKNSYDVNTSMHDELCYNSMCVRNCYRTFFSCYCEKSNDVWFSRDCIGCSNCLGCINLRNKQYHIFNQPYTKEAYEEQLRSFQLESYKSLLRIKKRVEDFWLQHPRKFMVSWSNVSVSGDMMAYCKNAKHCFNTVETEDSAYCQNVVLGVKDCYDFTIWGDKCEQIYEAIETGVNCRNVKFSHQCWLADQDIEYSMDCHSSSDLFGCVGLRKKQYSILNKQYTKEKYTSLRSRIIQHMDDMPYWDGQGRVYRYGEFFPLEFSSFGYNVTFANDFFPMTKEQAVNAGYAWCDPEVREFQTTIDAALLADDIKDVDDAILKEVIKCVSCARAYRVIPPELEFYHRMALPLPRICHNCRFIERTQYRNQPKFYSRTCQCVGRQSENGVYQNQASHSHAANHCPNEFETSYAPNRPEIVYCEECYQTEVS